MGQSDHTGDSLWPATRERGRANVGLGLAQDTLGGQGHRIPALSEGPGLGAGGALLVRPGRWPDGV